MRNPIHDYDPELVDAQRVSPAAPAKAVAALLAGRPPAGAAKAALLAKAIGHIDLTTLSGDDTHERVRALCARARMPLKKAVAGTLGVKGLTTASVCVYPALVETAVAALEGALPVAAVAAGFPDGLTPLDCRVREVEAAVMAGAAEIDIVIRRGHVLEGNLKAIYDEVRLFREACGPAHLKAILGTGNLATPTNIAKASVACMLAGADFIKTSTGKEKVNATPEAAYVMTRCIRDWHARTGIRVGFKPAGGISTGRDALTYFRVVEGVLGEAWLTSSLFRLGASSLLADIAATLEDFVAGATGAKVGTGFARKVATNIKAKK